MTWTYTGAPGNAGTTAATAQEDLDAVRLCIGDTDPTDQLLQDGEVQWLMLQEAGVTVGAMNVYRVASVCCYQIATRYSRQADKQIGPALLKSSQKSAQYKQRGDEWFFRSRLWDTLAVAGGISVADKQTQEQDSDRVRPFYTRNMQAIPGAITPLLDPGWVPIGGGV